MNSSFEKNNSNHSFERIPSFNCFKKYRKRLVKASFGKETKTSNNHNYVFKQKQ